MITALGRPTGRERAGVRRYHETVGSQRAVVSVQVSTAAGFESIVRTALEHDIDGLRVEREESALLVVTVPSRSLRVLAKVPYASLVLLELGSSRVRNLSKATSTLADQLLTQPVPENIDNRRGFRVRVSEAGELVRIAPEAKRRLEKAVGRWAGLRPDPRGGGAELWVRRRRDSDVTTLSLRVDSLPTDKPAAGALKRDVAAALVRVVRPVDDEIFLDPFAGSGAIPMARAAYGNAAILSADLDPGLAQDLGRLRRSGCLGREARTGRIDVTDGDALSSFAGADPVDTVVTDPPWGLYEGGAREVAPLYRAALRSLAQVMDGCGRVVLLSAAVKEVESALAASPFEVERQLGVLVNGKKASIIQARGRG